MLDRDGLDGIFGSSASEPEVDGREAVLERPRAIPSDGLAGPPAAPRRTSRKVRTGTLAVVVAVTLVVAALVFLRGPRQSSSDHTTIAPPSAVLAVPAPPAPPPRASPEPVAVANTPGEPMERPVPKEALFEAALPFSFRFNGLAPAPLTDAQTAALDAILTELEARCGTGAVLALTGHTDATGSSYANRVTGLARAMAVRDLLMGHLPSRVFLVASAGRSRPIASNTTIAGQNANRRVTAACVVPPSSPKELP